jgi:hypothetical protein
MQPMLTNVSTSLGELNAKQALTLFRAAAKSSSANRIAASSFKTFPFNFGSAI